MQKTNYEKGINIENAKNSPYYIKNEVQKPVEVYELNKNSWWLKKENYGPCEYSGCPYSSSCRFYLKIEFLDEYSSEWEGVCSFAFYYDKVCWLEEFPRWLTMENIGQVYDYLRKLESGEYWVLENSGSKTTQSSRENQGN